ncbi:MAG: hypothetical protein U9Q79_00840 [Candidatus Hydrogenedentes bacterium]|nr:hypothetical protein [Candidatus Hydrogenedentota bacterium]
MGEWLARVLGAISNDINRIFGPPLRWFFHPIDEFLAGFYMPTARIIALGFFIGTMVWVFVGLKEEYVNLEAPGKRFWYDLRIWTIVSMLPHLVVYFYF